MDSFQTLDSHSPRRSTGADFSVIDSITSLGFCYVGADWRMHAASNQNFHGVKTRVHPRKSEKLRTHERPKYLNLNLKPEHHPTHSLNQQSSNKAPTHSQYPLPVSASLHSQLVFFLSCQFRVFISILWFSQQILEIFRENAKSC